SNTQTGNIDNSERRAAIERLLQKIDDLDAELMDPQLAQLRSSLQALPVDTNAEQLRQLEQRLLVHLNGRIDSLAAALNARPVESSDVPEQIANRWVKQGYYKIEIYPRENLNDNDAMIAFVRQLQEYNNKIIGGPVINVEAGEAVITAFQSAMLYALVAISLLLLILVRVKLDALIILLSVLAGGVFTLALMLLFNMPFNFANIIGLPLLLGIGVDSGIHIANRFRQEHGNGGNIFMTSASRGVLVSSMTTVCSIGNLAFSAHTGTATMGLLLTLGLLAMMVSTMVVLPSFLIWHSKR
ncbi:MAG: MMPL family transporter, partial [Gammaproteobacteria bacterium]